MFISAVSLLLTGACYAQWSARDSLNLQKLLESGEELKLNPKAVRQIDFGSAVGTPRMSVEKKWMLPDESLPEALPKPKVVLSLMPYKANTPCNWDPVFQKKIRIPGVEIRITKCVIKGRTATGRIIRWREESANHWRRYGRAGYVSVS